MTHEEARERLLDLAYGELEPAERLQVEQHVSGCAGCAAELEGMTGTRAAAGLLPDPDPPRGRAELVDAARRAVGGMARPGRARWARPVGWMAVAAAILAVGGVTVRLLDGNPRRVAVPPAAEVRAPVLVPAPVPAPGALASSERMAAPAPEAKKARDVAEGAGARAELAREAQPFPPGTTGAFVSLDLRTGARFRVNPAGCATRFAPFSTFEIPGSLIGLETGVVKDPDAAWQQGQSLRTALARSSAWYFGELATRVGEPRRRKWLATFDYGNQDVSGGLDRFWMGRSLRISPDEQVAFLARLQRGEFPVARLHLELVKEVLAQGPEAGYRLVAKTGSSADGEGWVVGWVESPGGGCAFALHLTSPTFDEVARIRPGLARDLLRQAGCLPP